MTSQAELAQEPRRTPRSAAEVQGLPPLDVLAENDREVPKREVVGSGELECGIGVCTRSIVVSVEEPSAHHLSL